MPVSVRPSEAPVMRCLLCVAMLLASAASASPCRAHGPELAGLYMPMGFNLGYSTDGETAGFLFGGELSVARIWDDGTVPFWVGGYVDARWMPDHDIVRVGFGPEIGVGWVTLDFGYVAELRDGRTAHGFEVRLLASLALVHPYARAGVGPNLRTYAEIGILLKYPIPLRRETRRSRPGPEPEPERTRAPLPTAGADSSQDEAVASTPEET